MKSRFAWLFLIIGLFFFSLSSAESLGVFKQNDCIELYQLCDTCSYVNLSSVKLPSSQIIYINEAMTKQGVDYNYTFCNTSYLGEYSYKVCGDKGGSFVCEDIGFEITYSGLKITEGKAMLYIGFFVLLILLFIINFIGMGYLPKRNVRDEEGKIMSISYLKYFRDVLWITGWMLLIAIFYLASNIAFAFMEEQMFAKTLFMIFQIAFALTPVIIIIWLIWIFASMFHDIQFQKMLNRGIFPGGNL